MRLFSVAADDFNRRTGKFKTFPQAIFDISSVREVHIILIIDRQNESRRADADLRSEVDFQSSPVENRRRIQNLRFRNDVVQQRCPYPKIV